ncbi:DUF6247 family protein [Actinomycetospora cinnamomea]|uniref:Uncharacterized protein n=1 Tax=Actinomycetospora cinnamomea TaxID=663609 RepID=A0A2U1FFQ2_9PSEU|nr:DUF6247 family protein [Actinomycetospora cinnamomea]PVZ11024.1 hypothetical protein C8D89_104238 [Actinomycetospora cinnamomea]
MLSVELAIVVPASNAVSDPSSGELPALPRVGASPRQVRAALRPEHHESFDRALRDALEEAARELDLGPVHTVVEHWRRRAWITRDREQHRRIVREAVEELTGKAPPEDASTRASEARL